MGFDKLTNNHHDLRISTQYRRGDKEKVTYYGITALLIILETHVKWNGLGQAKDFESPGATDYTTQKHASNNFASE
jgi:hypothetical protein